MKRDAGFTLLEVIVTLVIVGLIASGVLVLQKNSWSSTRSSNKLIVAGHVIEKEIERMRSQIAEAGAIPTTAPNDTVIEGFTVKWTFATAKDLSDTTQTLDPTHVRKADIKAIWTVNSPETLSVSTYLARDF